MYTCPMHPEVRSDKPGRCPKCGMKLVAQGETNESTMKSYAPLIVIVSLLLLITCSLAAKDFFLGIFSIQTSISYFMIGFFLVFSGFKLMDLGGFAQGYAQYDLLAKRVFVYGYVYPFIELFFGLAMIFFSKNQLLPFAELVIMTFSGIGVLLKLLKKEKFQCACLGTFLKVPLTKITIIEDFGMAFLAALLLFL